MKLLASEAALWKSIEALALDERCQANAQDVSIRLRSRSHHAGEGMLVGIKKLANQECKKMDAYVLRERSVVEWLPSSSDSPRILVARPRFAAVNEVAQLSYPSATYALSRGSS